MATEQLLLQSEGTPSDWTLVAGSNKVSACQTPDDDNTSYIQSGTVVATLQRFTLADPADIGSGDTINSVTVRMRHRRGGTPAGTIGFLIYLGAAQTAGTLQTTGASWLDYSETLGKPGGGTWSLTDLQNLEVAVQNGQARNVFCTTLEVIVDYTPAGGSIIEIINEVEDVDETNPRLISMIRIISEIEDIVEVITRSRIINRIVSEANNVQEVIINSRVMTRVILEVGNIQEVRLKVSGFIKTVNETINSYETNIRELAIGIVRVVNETINIVENIVDIISAVGTSIVKVVNEYMNIQEYRNYARSVIKIIGDTVSILENGVKSMTLVRVILDVMNIQEIVLRARGLFKIVSETVNISEATLRKLGSFTVLLLSSTFKGMWRQRFRRQK